MAFVKSMGSLEEYRRDNETKHKLRMLLTDIKYECNFSCFQYYIKLFFSMLAHCNNLVSNYFHFHSDNDIECVLFDECSTNAYMAQLENMETPVVVLINLARIAFAEDGIIH